MFNYKITAMKKNLILLFFLILSIGIKAQIAFGTQDTLSTQLLIPKIVITADIDNDGILDAVTANYGTSGVGSWGQLVWFKNNNDGNKKFAVSDTIADNDTYTTLAVGDINGDGSVDVISIENSDRMLKWYSNDGSGNFSLIDTINTYITTSTIAYIQIADMNNNENNDVVIFYPNKLEWFENSSGDGTAWTKHTISTISINDFSISDIDNDGDLDIITAQVGDGQGNLVWGINVFINGGSANTWTQISLPNLQSIPKCIYTADLNNDNLDDVVIGTGQSTLDSARIMWYENQGSNNFSSVKNIFAIKASSGNYNFTDVQAADLDLDGNQDLIFSSSDNYVRIMRNKGDGTFENAQTVTNTLDNPISVFAADLDSVPDIDLLIASQNDNTIAYYNNYTAIITQDPQDAAPICVGTDSVMFGVKAINVQSYKWLENTGTGFGAISETDSHYHGQTSDTLYVDAWYANMNGYKYECKITGFGPAFSKDTSNFGLLTVDTKVVADVGTHPDQSLCEAANLTINGNDPAPNTGIWTSNISSTTFDDATAYSTIARNFGNGTIELYWTIDNKSCGTSTDTVFIKNYQNFTANAGTNETICDSVYQLQGNTPPELSMGTWTCTRSEVTFDDVHNPTTTVHSLPTGISNESRFKWEVNNGTCGASSAYVSIFRNEPVIADAGDDITLCNQTVTSLHGNDPGYHSTHYWTSSNPQIIISNSTYPQAGLSNIPHGTSTLTWTIDVPACGKTSDDVLIGNYNPINIETEPFNLTVNEGENALFGIVVTGDVKTYQWHKGNSPLTNDTHLSGTDTDTLLISNVVEQDTGMYKCIITDMCYENETSTNEVQLTVNKTSTGLDVPESNGIIIYPNPNKGIFNIVNSKNQIEMIKIYDLEGKLIYLNNNVNTKTTRIDISSYNKGVYIMEIVKNKKIIRSKLIVQ